MPTASDQAIEWGRLCSRRIDVKNLGIETLGEIDNLFL